MPALTANELFRPEEQAEGHRHYTKDEDRVQMLDALKQHVYGQKVTHIDFTRELDAEKSKELKMPVDMLEIVVTLENNIQYIAGIFAHSLFVVGRGDGLANLHPGDEHYTPPCTPTDSSSPLDSSTTKITGGQ